MMLRSAVCRFSVVGDRWLTRTASEYKNAAPKSKRVPKPNDTGRHDDPTCRRSGTTAAVVAAAAVVTQDRGAISRCGRKMLLLFVREMQQQVKVACVKYTDS